MNKKKLSTAVGRIIEDFEMFLELHGLWLIFRSKQRKRNVWRGKSRRSGKLNGK